MAGSLRKYVFNPTVVSAVLGIVPVLRATRKRPSGVRVAVIWLAWAAGVVLAVATTKEDSTARRSQTD